MARLAQISDWFWLERIKGVILLVGFAMLKWGVLEDVVANIVEVCCRPRDGPNISHLTV